MIWAGLLLCAVGGALVLLVPAVESLLGGLFAFVAGTCLLWIASDPGRRR